MGPRRVVAVPRISHCLSRWKIFSSQGVLMIKAMAARRRNPDRCPARFFVFPCLLLPEELAPAVFLEMPFTLLPEELAPAFFLEMPFLMSPDERAQLSPACCTKHSEPNFDRNVLAFSLQPRFWHFGSELLAFSRGSFMTAECELLSWSVAAISQAPR